MAAIGLAMVPCVVLNVLCRRPAERPQTGFAASWASSKVRRVAAHGPPPPPKPPAVRNVTRGQGREGGMSSVVNVGAWMQLAVGRRGSAALTASRLAADKGGSGSERGADSGAGRGTSERPLARGDGDGDGDGGARKRERGRGRSAGRGRGRSTGRGRGRSGRRRQQAALTKEEVCLKFQFSAGHLTAYIASGAAGTTPPLSPFPHLPSFTTTRKFRPRPGRHLESHSRISRPRRLQAAKSTAR